MSDFREQAVTEFCQWIRRLSAANQNAKVAALEASDDALEAYCEMRVPELQKASESDAIEAGMSAAEDAELGRAA